MFYQGVGVPLHLQRLLCEHSPGPHFALNRFSEAPVYPISSTSTERRPNLNRRLVAPRSPALGNQVKNVKFRPCAIQRESGMVVAVILPA
jgi:hypothetical protein